MATHSAPFLAEASAQLSASLDLETTLTSIAALVVPRLGDYCLVHMVDARGELQLVQAAHWDAARTPFAWELGRLNLLASDAALDAGAVMRSGQPVLEPRLSAERLQALTADPEQQLLLQQLGLYGIMIAPLEARGRRFGALTLISAESRREYGHAELAIAEEVASRAALALDNARLHDAELEARLDAEEALDRMARLQSVTGQLSRALPRTQVLDVIVRETTAALGAAAGGVVEIAEADREFRLAHSIGFPPEVRTDWARISFDAPVPLNDAAVTQMPVFLESPAEWLERYPNPAPDRLTFEDGAWAVLPFMVGDRLTGALTLSFATRRSFSEVDRQFMMALASQCAQALERGRLFDAELQARAEAESASRAKSQFLAVMSHELRTPLTAIIGYADLLHSEVSGVLVPKQKEHLERMRDSAWHLLQLISEILSLTRIEAGREQVDARPVPLAALATECIAIVQLQAQQKGIATRLDLPADEITIQTDPGKVRQVLLNLLSNAVKFTEVGEIGLRLEPTPTGGAILSVFDTGPGIAPVHHEYIFDAFTQVDQSMTRVFGGAGLGLSVSRRLTQLLDAELTLESAPGKGSVFRLQLPPTVGDGDRIAYS